METVIGISGASGACYGIRLLEVLGEVGCTTHLVMSEAARKIIEIETDKNVREIETMADHVYLPGDFTAPIASGSHPFDAMVVVPCSMRTLAGIANGVTDTLISRVADVGLKERRRLILVPRESPLSLIHLRNMVVVAEAGAVVLPACPGFYSRPRSLEDLVDVVVGRILDLLGLDHSLYRRWCGVPGRNAYNDGNQISN
ncbi:MAG: UbiX family flavin prenyltransferase [Methanothrix sp.]|nr:MAG: UbiX family flavin prenyltransferase [Methanothrix sp.]